MAMAHGIQLAEFYAAEALRLFNAGRISPDLGDAKRLLDWLQRQEFELITARYIVQKGPNGFRDTRTVKRLMMVLAEHGWVRPVENIVVGDSSCRQAWLVIGPTALV